uniref:Helitron helicase-like domain-containing protein n=1 Tax=Solanum lycopersicum TaxID=4081 RepID=A0A3Q7JCB7_SOLLC
MDAIVWGDFDCLRVGKTIILPSSHIGGPRCRAQNYQDAMVIWRWDGYPDLFLTFTCNPKWPEINEMQNLISQENDGSHVDIICRVFQIKLFQLMQHIKKQKPFGKLWHKRGLPHAHIRLFLHETLKTPSVDHIDRVIAAEIPNIAQDSDGYNAVKNIMIHEPCGDLNLKCPCEGTQVLELQKNGAKLDNRYVVPYNRNLLVQFDAHINVETCNYSKSVKYLFKPNIEKTKCTEWFEANKENADSRELTYSDFPTRWVWNAGEKKWTRRQKGRTAGRIYFAHPASGEQFYMCMMLNFVKVCICFQSIRTVNGIEHKTYPQAYYALGLLDDDKELNDCLVEASGGPLVMN